MKNLHAYIAGILMAVFAAIPPIYFVARAPSEYWLWWVMTAGLAGFYILFIKTNLIIKIIAIGGFINCFYSAAPYISFSAYIPLIACCYFYILCSRIKDYDIVFKFLQALLLFVGFMFIMQYIGHDRLTNFGRAFSLNGNYCFGIIGHRMQSASFSVILVSALIISRPRYLAFPFITSIFCNSVIAFLCASVGAAICLFRFLNKKRFIILSGLLLTIFLIWANMSGKLAENTNITAGRLAVWISSIKLLNQRPVWGWGLAEYKFIFPALGGMNSIPWKTAHNCWIQLTFELGYPLFSAIVFYVIYLYIKLIRLTKRVGFRNNSIQCLAGLSMITANMTFHFPTRMIQCTLIIIFFLAYCQKVIDQGGIENGSR